MKKIVIIGATGSLVPYVAEALLKLDNIQLTLFARSPKYIDKNLTDKCTIIQGDALEYESIKKVVAGQDVVYVNLTGNLEAMAKNIVKAMHEEGVNKVIAISSIGIYKTPLKPILRPYRALADSIEASGLDYTILRPNWFTNGSEIDYHITHKPDPEIGGSLSRRGIANFVAKVVANPEQYTNVNVGISKI
ncbi:NAD(P)H-binding protein [Flavobacterium sp. Sd200]|uniref:NAD(P)H-binding protein n=1 Tax=Flavobacterium sp. Sd200 TaxID=2692211 RepID=UPI00136805EB|nr:NAD(P)H-binding protein [Flavobacterium sp. Sd200]MXN90512.1 NAD(P)H-binding protein [Flavobacterium sp. Sd200]